jgi:hypothetical protein
MTHPCCHGRGSVSPAVARVWGRGTIIGKTNKKMRKEYERKVERDKGMKKIKEEV